MVTTWLMAWLLGAGAAGGLLAGAWSLATWRRLTRDEAPAPAVIVGRLWLAPLVSVLSRHPSAREAHLAGRRVWVWWDWRWGPSGESEAVVRSADQSGLRLSLRTPVGPFPGPDAESGRTTDVWFRPSRAPNYAWGIAVGTLQPAGSAGDTSKAPDDRPRARVCVL